MRTAMPQSGALKGAWREQSSYARFRVLQYSGCLTRRGTLMTKAVRINRSRLLVL